MKKIITLMVASQVLMAAVVFPVASAQTSASAGVTGYATPVVGSAPAYPTPPPTPAIAPMPPMPTSPPIDAGFIQFNNLTVDSVSGTSFPAEILANNPNIYPIMMDASGAATTANTITPSAPSGGCYSFSTQDSATSKAITCPTPSVAPTTPSAPSAISSGNTASIAYPIRYQPYRIEIDASTRLVLNDRTAASLKDFSSGDQINVFGYYNADGSIQAYLIRDLSKPLQDEFIQLNNVQLISISAGTSPATLIVTQSQGYPCYGFGVSGSAKQAIACPMGAQATTNSSALNNVTVPAALAPTWQMLRKYVITVDSQTIILDNNRTKLSLSDLRIGDQLNIYGDTTDHGQTLKADIIRDISIPAVPSAYNGTITQVSADGSFVIQTNDGQTITVQSPIQVGATVQLTGLLDRLKEVLSQVSNLYFGTTVTSAVPPVPMTAPGTLR